MALYRTTIEIMLPGNTPEEAQKRLVDKVPHYPFRTIEIVLAENQPPALVGTAHIRLPLIGVKNGSRS